MSLKVELKIKGLAPEALDQFEEAVRDRRGLNARIAVDAETFVKDAGREIAKGLHRTADTLGAVPTGHLAAAYAGIGSVYDAESARLLIPSATRLRAAFGPYVLTPKNGKRFLTIPAIAEAYGRRAGEFEDLFPIRTGPLKTPVLVRRVSGGKSYENRAAPGRRRKDGRRGQRLEVVYLLTPKAEIPENRELFPFEGLEREALRSAEAYIDEAAERLDAFLEQTLT